MSEFIVTLGRKPMRPVPRIRIVKDDACSGPYGIDKRACHMVDAYRTAKQEGSTNDQYYWMRQIKQYLDQLPPSYRTSRKFSYATKRFIPVMRDIYKHDSAAVISAMRMFTLPDNARPEFDRYLGVQKSFLPAMQHDAATNPVYK